MIVVRVRNATIALLSWVLFFLFLPSLIWSIYPRVTSAAIVRSPKGALATPADQRGSYFFVRLLNSRSSNDVSAGQAHLT